MNEIETALARRQLRDDLMDLVHRCGYCEGKGQTERCELDTTDLRIADRVTAYLLRRERELGIDLYLASRGI